MPISKDGKEYKYNGQVLILYPISVLADKLSEAIEDSRSTQTIRKWEINKVIPPAIFRVGQKRLYTMEQINVICKVAKECKIRQGCSLALAKFSTQIWKKMRIVNRKYLEKR